jgi:hypothetical protein
MEPSHFGKKSSRNLEEDFGNTSVVHIIQITPQGISIEILSRQTGMGQ